MRTPRLSVCIATRNRSSFIGQSLRSILDQADDDVEVVVVDGASSDSTPDVVGRMAEADSHLRYFRLDHNGGVDRDYDRCVELASGEFCWLMTDDDILLPGAVSAVLGALSADLSLLLVNSEVRNATLGDVLEERRLEISSNRRYEPSRFEEFFRDTADFLTFIGGVVIRRSIWMSRDRETYHDSLFIHVGVIFQKALDGAMLVLEKPGIAIRYGNAMWTPRSFEIWAFKWPSLVWSFRDFSEASRGSVVRPEPWRGAFFLLMKRGEGAYSISEYRQWIVPRTRSVLERVIPFVIALVPGIPLNICLRLAHRLLPRRSGLALLDLKRSRFCSRS